MLVLWLAGFVTAEAQREPRIGYVYPAGGQQGTTIEVLVGGQYLDGARQVLVSGAGVTAEVIEHDKPFPQQRVNAARETLAQVRKEMQAARKEGRFETPEEGLNLFLKLAGESGYSRKDLVKLAELRRQRDDPKRQLNPQLAETLRLKITIAADAGLEPRELRVAARDGWSNPLTFLVGRLPEMVEPRQPLDLMGEYFREWRRPAAPTTAAVHRVKLPTVVNGQILPGEVDHYRFHARRGQQVVVAVQARALIPYLADAVPGWFQAVVRLTDAVGAELAYADDFFFHPDPALCFTIPKDGDYRVEIRDAIHRGREDFVYRLTLGEVPWITGVFPLGCTAGEQTPLEWQGWNLQSNAWLLDARQKAPGIWWVSADEGGGARISVDDLPETREAEPNHRPEMAQRLVVPCIVNGRIEAPGDVDVFRFAGRAGQAVVVEVMARRLDSPLDSVIRLLDSQGRALAVNDDHADPGAGLTTHHADSRLTCTLPADGCYFVELADVQRQGGPLFAYRLRVSAPRPDFELRATPASLNARPGMPVPLTVHVLRKDGFAGGVELGFKNSAPGWVLDGGQVPPGEDAVRFTLMAPGRGMEAPLVLELEGRATVGGRELVRPVVPAEDMMQAFFYRHLVPVRDLVVGVSGPARRLPAPRVMCELPLKIPAGGQATIPVGLMARAFPGTLQFELDAPPKGLALAQVRAVEGGAELVLASDVATAGPGLKGNLIVGIFSGGGASGAREARRSLLGFLPAIPFEVVACEP